MQTRNGVGYRFAVMLVSMLWSLGFAHTSDAKTKGNSHPHHVATADDTILRVACTIYGEAANQTTEGKRAVASVIYTRAGDHFTKERSTWVRALRHSCVPGAFSCWNKGWPKAPNWKRPADRTAWYECYSLARELVSRSFVPSIDSHYYHEASIKPWWSKGMTMLCQVGSHKFYP